MADTKISALTPITPVVGTQLIPISTVGLLNGSITPAGILSYGTSPVTGTTGYFASGFGTDANHKIITPGSSNAFEFWYFNSLSLLNVGNGYVRTANTQTLGFSSTGDSGGTSDATFSRISAGVIGVGTGTAGYFDGGLKLTDLTINRAATFLTTSVALTNGAGASAGTLTNAPAVGNPTKWIGINDNGTTRYIPAW
jgi:hypothetical protein